MTTHEEDYLHLRTMIEKWGIENLSVIIGRDIDITQFAGIGFNSVNYSDRLDKRQWVVTIARDYRLDMFTTPRIEWEFKEVV